MTSYQIVPVEGDVVSPAPEDKRDDESKKTRQLISNGAEMEAPKIFKRRWFMLMLFVLVSTSNAFNWIQVK